MLDLSYDNKLLPDHFYFIKSDWTVSLYYICIFFIFPLTQYFINRKKEYGNCHLQIEPSPPITKTLVIVPGSGYFANRGKFTSYRIQIVVGIHKF